MKVSSCFADQIILTGKKTVERRHTKKRRNKKNILYSKHYDSILFLVFSSLCFSPNQGGSEHFSFMPSPRILSIFGSIQLSPVSNRRLNENDKLCLECRGLLFLFGLGFVLGTKSHYEHVCPSLTHSGLHSRV